LNGRHWASPGDNRRDCDVQKPCATVACGCFRAERGTTSVRRDPAHVIGMNRLRAAYVELDPAIERYLVTSPHDDHEAVWQTYNPS